MASTSQGGSETSRIDPYLAVALQTKVVNVATRNEVKVNLDHIGNMIDLVCHICALELPVRLITLGEGAIQGFIDEIAHLSPKQFSDTMDYNFGRIDTGTYFFRPAMVKHGHFSSGMDRGAAWIFRLDGSLINWITVEEDVIIKGRPLNYDPKTQAPVMAGIPVRSRSTGDWDLDGQ